MATALRDEPTLEHYTLDFRDAVRAYRDEFDPFFRGHIATEVFRGCPGAAPAMLRAEVIARALETLPIPIIDEALLAGIAIRRMRVHGGISDEEGWRRNALFPEDAGVPDDLDVPPEFTADYEWWRTEGAQFRRWHNQARAADPWIARFGIASPHGFSGGHTLPDHGILLGSGIAELRERLATQIAEASTDTAVEQFRAMDRCLVGLSTHIRRCGAAAAERAEAIDDSVLAGRLRAVAARCTRIATERPEGYAEALQLLYFSNFVDRIGNSGDASSFGRVDQILWPWYEQDLESGVLSTESAFELTCHFVIKVWGDQESRNVTVGGVQPDGGSDATNELSWELVRAMDVTDTVIDLSVRVHSDTPDEFLDLVAGVMRRHFGRPDVYNDDVTIPALVRAGVDLADARNYAPLGCVEVMIPGRSAGRTMCMGLNHLKILELVLNRGRCLVTGERVWHDVPGEYESYDALEREFLARIELVVSRGVDIIREDELCEPSIRPRPWLTVLSHGGLEDGRDLTAGQPKYDLVGVTMDGVADVANSLYAIDRLVFRENRLSLDELRSVLIDNWETHESLRAEVVHTFPRFGQDIAEVDSIAARVAEHYARRFDGRSTAYDGPFLPMIFGVTTGLLLGRGPKTGAGASGRRCGEVLSQSLQPSSTGRHGSPTEVLRSAAAVDNSAFPGGISNVQNFDPTLVQGEWGVRNIRNLIRGFFSLGGMELAMNFVSADQLREARERPDEYPYLMVRLFGMSARFVLLSPELQEEVIRRAEAAARG